MQCEIIRIFAYGSTTLLYLYIVFIQRNRDFGSEENPMIKFVDATS